ncbi:hypothetical protein [Gracilimonas mengyeensis]|uniref:hypothetical protein n=1 Tax=Gracilimonas mengyeensis TaxID=1302730 RepID=UPI001159A854|nr:hypothetical protein [Gracilimonas mengyeensis]
MKISNGKKIITALLALSCVISGIILASAPEKKALYIESPSHLDSLINDQIFQTQIRSPQIYAYQVKVDSGLYRKVYEIDVPSRFSKTLFHINLHKQLHKYGAETPAEMHFPERDMDIYVYYHDSVQRIIRLMTDTDLDTTQTGGPSNG